MLAEFTILLSVEVLQGCSVDRDRVAPLPLCFEHSPGAGDDAKC